MSTDGFGSHRCQTIGLDLLFGKYGYKTYPQRIKDHIEMDTSQAEVPTNENWIVIRIYLNSFQVHTYNSAETYL